MKSQEEYLIYRTYVKDLIFKLYHKVRKGERNNKMTRKSKSKAHLQNSATLSENFGSPYLPRTPFFVNEKMKAKNRSKAANARNAIFCYITKSCFGREQRKKAVSNLTHFWVLVTFMCVSTKLYRQVQLQWEICTLILADGVNSRMGAEI